MLVALDWLVTDLSVSPAPNDFRCPEIDANFGQDYFRRYENTLVLARCFLACLCPRLCLADVARLAVVRHPERFR